MTFEQQAVLLAQTNWIDRTLWVSRQLFGGQALNGFLRATATAQHVKKQRARQTASARAKTTITPPNEDQQQAEEQLKLAVMNARTAKKIKTEFESGLQFCEFLHGTIRQLLQDMDPVAFVPPPPLGRELPSAAPRTSPLRALPTAMTAAPKATTSSKGKAPATKKPPPALSKQAPTTASPGNPTGSTLRRHRRKKLPPSNEPTGSSLQQLLLMDSSNNNQKKKYTKKEWTHRVTELVHFRSLRQGNFVTACLSSRDLWILARVLKDYKGLLLEDNNNNNMSPAQFLQLSQTRREQVFCEKVVLRDVEEKAEDSSSSSQLVSRSLVLPLPHSFSEAAEWGQRAKKGSRVYAMYPQTTSLYSATVVDNTTYCRQDDDIIVVEFDGDEPDAVTGLIPQCHILARFVTLIPREFPASQANNNNSSSTTTTTMTTTKVKTTNSRKCKASAMVQSAAAAMLDDPMNGVLDDMTFDGGLPGLEGFDDLDFDLLGGA